MRLQALQLALWTGIEEMDAQFITENRLNPAEWKNPAEGYTVSPLCCVVCILDGSWIEPYEVYS